MSFERILVPIDFSEGARHAATWGAALASRLGAQLSLLHVLDLPEWHWSAVEKLPEETKQLQVDLLAKARDRLGAEWEELSGGLELEPLLRARAGVPAQEILAEARESQADLVVIATHGLTGVARALLGSTAEKLVRTSSVPLLSVHADHAAPPAEGGSLLFATDLSEASLAALPTAGALASRLGLGFTALHVLEEPRLSIGTFEEVFGLAPEEMQARLEEKARAAVRDQLEPELPDELELDVTLLGGTPHEEIVREAGDGSHSLIVMGTQGRTNLGEALLGSTAERVVRTSGVPVLTVRAQD